MTTLHGFLGRDMDVPDDRRYDGARHYWLKQESGETGESVVTIGYTEPGVALTGGLVELEVFPEAGDALIVDQEIAFATTKKNMKYFLSPVAARVFAGNSAATAGEVTESPYDTWLVKVVPGAGWDAKLLDAAGYVVKMSASEHATPEAAQAAKAGKGSPTCKSIYSGIKEG